MNKSIGEGIVPDEIQIANIIPVYKSKATDSYCNCRPISLLPSISKSKINDVTFSDMKKDSILSAFLYLSKAFNTINFHILLHKLEYYGIRGTPLTWFKLNLSNRKYNCDSLQQGVTRGAPLFLVCFCVFYILRTFHSV